MSRLSAVGDHVLGGLMLSVILWSRIEFEGLVVSQPFVESTIQMLAILYAGIVLYLFRQRAGSAVERVQSRGRGAGVADLDADLLNQALQESETARRAVIGLHFEDADQRDRALDESPTLAGEVLEAEARGPL